MVYDVIIIGAGPAGISASLYTKRANLNTLIIYFENSSLEKAKLIENYYGFENGIDGKTLYETGIKQAKNLGVEVKKEELLKIELDINDDGEADGIIYADLAIGGIGEWRNEWIWNLYNSKSR